MSADAKKDFESESKALGVRNQDSHKRRSTKVLATEVIKDLVVKIRFYGFVQGIQMHIKDVYERQNKRESYPCRIDGDDEDVKNL